jgi:Flp pilus assembly protein CpaB
MFIGKWKIIAGSMGAAAVLCWAVSFKGPETASSSEVAAKSSAIADAEPEPKEEPIMVLVANSDFYPNIAITAADVRVRQLTPEEISGGFYDKNKGKFLPPNAAAVNLRIPNQKIKADTVLMREHFKEEHPDPVSLRLDRGMSAVTVVVPKQHAAGGVIQLGEFVDVWLFYRLNDGEGKTKAAFAQIARDCRVIMKGDKLYQTQILAPAEKTVSFTLEANPYRAALVDYAQQIGAITLLPIFKENPNVFEARRDVGMGNNLGRGPIFSDMTSEEYRDEDVRVAKSRGGD